MTSPTYCQQGPFINTVLTGFLEMKSQTAAAVNSSVALSFVIADNVLFFTSFKSENTE